MTVNATAVGQQAVEADGGASWLACFVLLPALKYHRLVVASGCRLRFWMQL